LYHPFSKANISKVIQKLIKENVNSMLFLLMRLNFHEYHDMTPIVIGGKSNSCLSGRWESRQPRLPGLGGQGS